MRAATRIGFCLMAIVATNAPLAAAAGEGKTVVLGPAVKPGIPKRYVERTRDSFRAAMSKTKTASVGESGSLSPACAAEAACLARAGRAAGAERVVGTALVARGSRFELVFLAVEVASGRTLERYVGLVRNSSALRKVPGEQLGLLIERLSGPGSPNPDGSAGDTGPREVEAAGDETPREIEAAAGTAPLKIEVSASVVGDGRSAIPVRVTGGPPARAGELRTNPELARLECEGASVLPATRDALPAVLAPAVAKPRSVSCVAHLRGAQKPFELRVQPPTGGGVFASAEGTRFVAKGPPVRLVVFAVGGDGRAAPPRGLRAQASGGSVASEQQGWLTLALPAGRAPRMIVIALASESGLGAAFVPLVGVANLPVEAAPRAKVSARIAGTWVPPIRVRRRRAEIPIEVPPGVKVAVLRATERGGGAVESLVDLRVPDFPRIAAVAGAEAVQVSERMPIAIAVADSDSRPAAKTASVVVEAREGRIASVRALGGGLWVAEYLAPAKAGDDEVTANVEGDPGAGAAVVRLRATPADPATIEIETADTARRPGENVTGTFVVRDRNGNFAVDPPPTATLAGERVAVERHGDGFRFRGVVPDRLPDGRFLLLVVEASRARAERRVAVRADAPASAAFRARVYDRLARLALIVLDRHGNLVEPEAFSLSADGASVRAIHRRGDAYRTTLRARPGTRRAEVEVVVDGKPLAHRQVTFGPPRKAFVLGAYGHGGWVARQQSASSPRFGAGLGMRRWLGPVETSILFGPELSSSREQSAIALQGEDRDVSLELTRLAFPVTLRGRVPLSLRVGAALAVAVVPERVAVAITSDFQESLRYSEAVTGVRGSLELDISLGPRRVTIGADYDYARLADGPVSGKIGGFAVSAGLEWWFADLGP